MIILADLWAENWDKAQLGLIKDGIRDGSFAPSSLYEFQDWKALQHVVAMRSDAHSIENAEVTRTI